MEVSCCTKPGAGTRALTSFSHKFRCLPNSDGLPLSSVLVTGLQPNSDGLQATSNHGKDGDGLLLSLFVHGKVTGAQWHPAFASEDAGPQPEETAQSAQELQGTWRGVLCGIIGQTNT